MSSGDNLKTDRKRFLGKNIKDITNIEKFYLESKSPVSKSKTECQSIRKEYKESCKKSDILNSLEIFYKENWLDETSQKIDQIGNMKELRELKTELYRFKSLLRIKEEVEENIELDIEKMIVKCIKNRISYKYYCTKNPDKNHDYEILRHIFYQERLQELKILFLKIKERYILVKEKITERRRQQNERRRQEDEENLLEEREEMNYIKTSNSDSSSDTFIPVVVSKNYRNRK
jgi:hypothetical protein